MSDSARDLLVRGIAFAKEGAKQEARYFLEFALREEPDWDQKAEAWLWLSKISADPAEKRSLLEQVLSVDLANAEARKDLAILEGRLKPEEILDPWRADAPVARPAPRPEEVRRYVCPKCGGKLAFEPSGKALACAYCGTRLSEYEAIMRGALVTEQDFVATLPTIRGHTWELPSERALACQGCGAHFTLPPARVSGDCPFCGSAYVIAAKVPADLVAPGGVALFQFDVFRAMVHGRAWLEAQRFRPRDLGDRAALSEPRPVYLPYWTFDIYGEVRWQEEVLEQEGDRHAWIQRQMSEPVLIDDLLVPASHSLPAALVDRLGGFDTKALAPYSPDFLADWPAEIYQIALAEASLVARQRAVAQAEDSARRQGVLDQVRNHSGFNSAGVVINNYKLVLLPVWLTEYRYKGARHPVVINGQTGEVEGLVPRSGWQRMLSGLLGGD
jgi:DNA-directed RNA polymerase subunit RPC12/RpoP